MALPLSQLRFGGEACRKLRQTAARLQLEGRQKAQVGGGSQAGVALEREGALAFEPETGLDLPPGRAGSQQRDVMDVPAADEAGIELLQRQGKVAAANLDTPDLQPLDLERERQQQRFGQLRRLRRSAQG
jgi:hypothetical protein